MTELKGQMDAHVAVLEERMRADSRIVAMTADLVGSCRLTSIEAHLPERFLNVGVAEQNMLSVAAGLALSGMRPVTHTFSVFSSLRACEQLRTDIFYNETPVVVVGTHSGVSTGPAGPTHYSIEDIAIVRAMPQSVIFCPSDAPSAAWAISEALKRDRPAYIRLDRNPLPVLHSSASELRFGVPQRVYAPIGGSVTPVDSGSGGQIIVFACGALTSAAVEAASMLGPDMPVVVYDCITIKPLDAHAVRNAVSGASMVVTAEEHTVLGGLGGAISEVLAESGSAPPLTRIGVQDHYPKGGPVDAVRRRIGLDPESIAERIQRAYGQMRGGVS